MEKPRQSRRQFLVALVALLALAGGMWRFLVPRKARKEALLRVPKAELPANGALVYRQSRIALVREGGNIIALSLVCPHLGCTVSVTPTGMVCPCHGSRFNRKGELLNGPATEPLAQLALESDGEYLVVTGRSRAGSV